MPPFRTAGRTAAAALLATSLLLAGCGDDDDDADATDTTEEAPETTEAPDTTAAPIDEAGDGGIEDGVLEVHLVDYAFEQLPASVPAGTRLTVVNDSQEELHELVAFRIPDDEARPVDELVTLPEEEVEAIFGTGPPATVLLAPPGGEQVDAVGDGTLTEPGRYAIVCFIPTGADPDAYLNAPPGDGPPDVPGGPPHVTHGMHAELTVE